LAEREKLASARKHCQLLFSIVVSEPRSRVYSPAVEVRIR
jgi:hypothetical protein